ncbi:MAG: SPOR domain-containing protein [Blastocatellia bacterium]|nr:SPOR domain-containing protein [Blastocatellia bacterium]
MVPPIYQLCVTLLLLFVCLGSLGADAKAMDYAVQIAALRSQQSADDLAKGLRSQGINAYWVTKNMPPAGMLYRVRVGKFSTLDSAMLYAEELMDSGIFTAYAIAAYETPNIPALGSLPAKSRPADNLQAFVSTTNAAVGRMPAARFDSETIDLVASIGTRGWLLLSSREVLASAQSNNQTALSRELARLAASVGSRGWSLNNNLAKLFARPEPPSAPSTMEIARNSASSASMAPTTMPAANVAPPVAIANEPAIPAPALRASAASAPEIGRRPLAPTRPGGTPLGSPGLANLAPVKLQGAIEMRNGQLFMTLRNLDPERAFTGNARVMLTNDRTQQDITPMPIAIDPDQEQSFPINEARVVDGEWMLMVYDQGGKARLVRGASLAPPRRPAPQPDAQVGQAGPPAMVTGEPMTFDATGGWRLAEAPAPESGPGNSNPAANLMPQPEGPASSNGANGQNGGGAPGPAAPPQDNSPAQVTVTPRQIAVTSENVILEFDIAASRPLNYVVITLRAGQYQDTRQALMTTPQGRVPFLVPVASAAGGFTYELKDEAGAVLATGVGDFRRLGR